MESSSEILGWTGQAILTWTNSGIKLQQGLSLNTIMDFEEQLNFQFPQDFKELYQKVNGFEDFEWNKQMFSLWSLNRILKEYQEV
jgi:cell wall assembly regulator SMI1